MKSLFFVSSRRRHTRLQGDWSSDVCSSDLPCTPAARIREAPLFRSRSAHLVRVPAVSMMSSTTKIGRASCRERRQNSAGGEARNRKREHIDTYILRSREANSQSDERRRHEQ